MKLYTSHTGKFQMLIPISWEYKNHSLYHAVDNNNPQAFGAYGSLIGAFQISCKPINEHISKLIKTRKEPIQSSDSKELFFSETKTQTDKDEVYLFTCAVNDHYFLATYVITNKKKKLIKKYEEELGNVRHTLSTIKFIKSDFRSKVIAQRRYDLFMASIATTIDLMNKALEKKSLIEYVALSANHIDALLRLSIILKSQIENKNDDIDTSFLFQAEGDKPLMERNIYNIALDKKIITQQIFDELELLYKQRNKVIHRFIITDIRTEDIIKIAVDYHKTGEKVETITNDLEKKQTELKVGIHKDNTHLGEKIRQNEFNVLISKIRDKHGKIDTDEILGEKIK